MKSFISTMNDSVGYMRAEKCVTKTRFHMVLFYNLLQFLMVTSFLKSHVFSLFYFVNFLNKQQIKKCNKIFRNKKNDYKQANRC